MCGAGDCFVCFDMLYLERCFDMLYLERPLCVFCSSIFEGIIILELSFFFCRFLVLLIPGL